MSEIEFLITAVAEWQTLVILTAISVVVLFRSIRRAVVGGVFDPMILAWVVGYSVNYAVVALLVLQGKVSAYLAFIVFGYGLLFIVLFRWFSRRPGSSRFAATVNAITPKTIGSSAFAVALAIYLAISAYIITSIGFGIFAETNRFDAGRGFGAYIRLLDFLSPFIVSYSTLAIFSSAQRSKLKIFLLLAFVGYAAMVNGAKISIIFSLFTVFFTLTIAAIRVKIRPVVAVACVIVGLAFSVVALSINLERNSVTQDAPTTELASAGLLVEKFAYRVIASGDASYLLLPNNVIDKIDTDSAWVRFLAPFLGTGLSNKLFGYPVEDYSVGRQALLFYDTYNDVAGGPTSHFDLFSYVYFGPLGGCAFVACLAFILGSINRVIRRTSKSPVAPLNKFRIALLATLWTRAVLVIIEPTVALAYIADILIFFTLLSLFLQLVLAPAGRRVRLTPAPLPAH